MSSLSAFLPNPSLPAFLPNTSLSAFLPNAPDPAARQPFSTAAFLVPCSLHYVLAVLAILPHTFILKLALFPIFLWQVWKFTVEQDLSVALANSLGHESSARLRHWNYALAVRFCHRTSSHFFLTPLTTQTWLVGAMLRSLAWTFAREPLRRYNPPVEGQQAAPIERPLTIQNVLLDAFDLMFNLRGIGWSWSPKPFPKASTWSTSTPGMLARLLLNFVAFDTSHYLIQRIRPSLNDPAGDTIFDSTLSIVPRFALAAFCTICAAVMVGTRMNIFSLITSLIGRILFRQPAWRYPPLFQRPWESTSLAEFWSFHWHQNHRYVFVSLGARPLGAILGRPGALLGAFAVSGVKNNLQTWALGNGMETRSVSGFFLITGSGLALEYGFKQVTGHRVGGPWGWLWTLVWSVCWGTMIIDSWARSGFMASDFFAFAPRPGKWLVDAIASL